MNAQTEDRAAGPQLVATWACSATVLSEPSVREFAQTWFDALRALVSHTRQRSAR